MTKLCRSCGEVKDVSEFGSSFNNVHNRSYLHSKCRPCYNAFNREYNTRPGVREKKNARAHEYRKTEAGRAAQRRAWMKFRYGITQEQFEVMAAAQDGKCAVCFKLPGKKGLFVDHDHATGQVRELLCTNCNAMIGMAFEDRSTLASAITYLAKHVGFQVIREAK